MAGITRVARAMGAEAAAITAERLRRGSTDGEDKRERPEWTQSDEPVAEETKRVARIAWETYREQLNPWIFFFAALFAAAIVRGNHYGALTILTAPVLAAGCYVVTKWRLTQIAVKHKRIDYGQTTGKRVVRITHRSNRAAVAGAGLGLWLFVVAMTPDLFMTAVYALGIAVWAMATYGGWWLPAEQAGQPARAARLRRTARGRRTTTPDGQHDDGKQPAEGDHDDDADTDHAAATTAPPPPPQAPSEKPVRQRVTVRLPSRHLLKPATTRTASIPDLSAEIDGWFESIGLDARVVDTTRGPIIMRYNVLPGKGVSVKKIEGTYKDLKRVTKSADMQILSPVPGEDVVGIEVPLPKAARRNVTLREVLDSLAAAADQHPLLIAMGMQMDGTYVVYRLNTMPHVLLGGATGAGKSSGLHAILMSILTRATPDDVRLILIDPKRVELKVYEGVPHLRCPIITKPQAAADKLAWLVDEMDRRYDLLEAEGVANIDEYNKKVSGSPLEHLVCVIDELADLMMTAPKDSDGHSVEDHLVRLLQLARAAGIHLVLATQRPSVDVITGLLKANLPSRWAYKTSSLADSRVILDHAGAEKLAGFGDSLFLPMGETKPIRLQTVWVTPEEREAVVADLRGLAPSAPAATTVATAPTPTPDGEDIDPELLSQAAELVITSQFGSTSMLQRKLRIGFALAGRVMDQLQHRGVVGPAEGSKARDVIAKPDELEEVQERLRGGQPAPAERSVAGTLTARDALLQDIRDLVQYDEGREIPYEEIVDATPAMNPKTRDKALGDLARENPPRLRRVRQGVYQLTGNK